jgi:hypothetical protein
VTPFRRRAVATPFGLTEDALRLALPGAVSDATVQAILATLEPFVLEHVSMARLSAYDTKLSREWLRAEAKLLEELLDAYAAEGRIAQCLPWRAISFSLAFDPEAHAAKVTLAQRRLEEVKRWLAGQRRPPREDRVALAAVAGRALLRHGVELDLTDEGSWSCMTRHLIEAVEGLARDACPTNVRSYLERAEPRLRRIPTFKPARRPGRIPPQRR